MKDIKSVLFGLAIGDALGVPVEFTTRESLKRFPVLNMRAFGTHHQPEGTWSDDSSLAFCLSESLINGYDLADMAKKFIDWKQKAYWTAHDRVFDIGITTSAAIANLGITLQNGKIENLKFLNYLGSEDSNGNGSLMRIIPLYFYLKSIPKDQWFDLIWDCSALTHGHIRSGISCFIYLVLIDELNKGLTKIDAYQAMQSRILKFFEEREIAERERLIFAPLIQENILQKEEDDIRADGYVISSLFASIWCFLKNDGYEETVLAAVNLGEDTDTTGAIAGGLAGFYYGYKSIPKNWIQVLARKDDIEDLCIRFENALIQ